MLRVGVGMMASAVDGEDMVQVGLLLVGKCGPAAGGEEGLLGWV